MDSKISTFLSTFFELRKKYMKPIFALFVYSMIPTMIGALVYVFTKSPSYIELSYFVFAIIELMLMIGRANRNDRINMQEHGTTRINKESDEYQSFKNTQHLIFYSALINLTLAIASFHLFGV